MTRRVAILLSLVALLVLAGSGAAWAAARRDQDLVARTARQQDVFATARSALQAGNCGRARTLLATVIALGADPDTTRQAASDQNTCQRVDALKDAASTASADTVLAGYLDLLRSDPPPGLVPDIRLEARAVLRTASGHTLPVALCERYRALAAEQVLSRQRGTLTDYRFLISCWNVLRRSDKAAAADLLTAIRKKLPIGVTAGFTGPERFSGGGKTSRVRVRNTAKDELYVIMAGAGGASVTTVPRCTRVCTSRYSTECSTDASRTITFPPGSYWMLMLDTADSEIEGRGARGLWDLRAGRVDQCVI